MRFAFGANWARFLRLLDEDRIAQAEQSLRTMLEVESLQGRRFLDVGSGSGLFSLAARRLGATVHSFDCDPQSVACTRELKRRFFPGDPRWTIDEASVLDIAYLSGLSRYDVVYSWGVLHHTGAMWQAMQNVVSPLARGGALFIALYNHQPLASRYWTLVKRLYNRHPAARPLLVLVHAIYPTLPGIIVRALSGRRRPRGMDAWRDLIDWIGGYPFEVSRPEQVLAFYRERGLTLDVLRTAGGRLGCNEFVFRRPQVSEPAVRDPPSISTMHWPVGR